MAQAKLNILVKNYTFCIVRLCIYFVLVYIDYSLSSSSFIIHFLHRIFWVWCHPLHFFLINLLPFSLYYYLFMFSYYNYAPLSSFSFQFLGIHNFASLYWNFILLKFKPEDKVPLSYLKMHFNDVLWDSLGFSINTNLLTNVQNTS